MGWLVMETMGLGMRRHQYKGQTHDFFTGSVEKQTSEGLDEQNYRLNSQKPACRLPTCIDMPRVDLAVWIRAYRKRPLEKRSLKPLDLLSSSLLCLLFAVPMTAMSFS